MMALTIKFKLTCLKSVGCDLRTGAKLAVKRGNLEKSRQEIESRGNIFVRELTEKGSDCDKETAALGVSVPASV